MDTYKYINECIYMYTYIKNIYEFMHIHVCSRCHESCSNLNPSVVKPLKQFLGNFNPMFGFKSCQKLAICADFPDCCMCCTAWYPFSLKPRWAESTPCAFYSARFDRTSYWPTRMQLSRSVCGRWAKATVRTARWCSTPL